ncbi:hypothetical protein JCM21900_004997 [Sporobolomyces salmonicolor]
MSVPVAAGAIAAAAYANARLGNDLVLASGLVNARIGLAVANARDKNSIYYYFDAAQHRQRERDCYVFEGQTLSWSQVAIEVNRLAHWLRDVQGIARGQRIALYMPNKPAFVIIWLACLALDIVPAFINYNLTGQGLVHCINVACPSLVIYDSDYAVPIVDAASSLKAQLPALKFVRWFDRFSKSADDKGEGELQGEIRVNEAVLGGMSSERIPDEARKGVSWQDPCCLIYTSGTTGLPKAATVTHGRSATAFRMWTKYNGFDSATRIYTPMPLYHSTAALLAIGAAWNAHACVSIGRKFSATSFWDDVRSSRANTIQYVGEVLRYLLSVPPSPLDQQHQVRIAYGNGCRPDVWKAFRERFGVRVVSEFFASSEGNGSLLNYNANDFGAGAVGREGPLVGFFQRKKQVIVKVDPLTEEPFRNDKGFCVRADPNEPGELIIMIDNSSPYQAFAGYHNNEAGTNKKILQNVFKQGDTYFRTGDLLRRDPDGLFYFADRLGDTFRWKSENVSTTTVQEALNEVVKEANVYGVLVPSHEGRAGCAAIPKSAGPVDFPKLSAHVAAALPKYAQPLFIRLVDKLESTGTEKQLKVALRNEGVDPAVVKDEVWWLDPRTKQYVRFQDDDWRTLQAGKIRL